MGILLFCGYPRVSFSLGQWCIWPTPILSCLLLKCYSQIHSWAVSLMSCLEGEGISLGFRINSHFCIHHLHSKSILYDTWVMTADLSLVILPFQFIWPITAKMVHSPSRQCFWESVEGPAVGCLQRHFPSGRSVFYTEPLNQFTYTWLTLLHPAQVAFFSASTEVSSWFPHQGSPFIDNFMSFWFVGGPCGISMHDSVLESMFLWLQKSCGAEIASSFPGFLGAHLSPKPCGAWITWYFSSYFTSLGRLACRDWYPLRENQSMHVAMPSLSNKEKPHFTP